MNALCWTMKNFTSQCYLYPWTMWMRSCTHASWPVKHEAFTTCNTRACRPLPVCVKNPNAGNTNCLRILLTYEKNSFSFFGDQKMKLFWMWHKLKRVVLLKKFPFSLETDANSFQLLSALKLVWQSIFNRSMAGTTLTLSETGDFCTSSMEHKNNMCSPCTTVYRNH